MTTTEQHTSGDASGVAAPGAQRSSIASGTTMAVSSVGSVQFGAAIAATLFPVIGPIGTVTLRLLVAAVVLALTNRLWRFEWRGARFGTIALFGVVLVTMNSSLYLALDRLPLATTITLEFLGPLAVALGTAASRRERWWVLPAAAGVALLGGTLRLHDLLGVVFALMAAGCWASYILLSRRLGRAGGGQAGLALATALGAVIILPVGVVTAGPMLWHPATLALGLAVGLLSSAIPYSLDMMALRRLPTAVFGVLTSLNPAVGALAGLLILGQHLPVTGLIGIALVMAAGAGITLGARHSGRRSAGSPAGTNVQDTA
ncbi:inner membrane transporter RhtA [Nakamurella sp. UYEF19]|uniref:EamA family transporter n=1 Tax=Nakamurella sp. UYEF19 TaxID=1756392 RepID=UPI0033914FF1